MKPKIPKITVSEIRKRVKEIRDLKGDYEAQHSREDDLYIDVLKAIAAGQRKGLVLANEALAAQRIKFPRHSA